MTRIKKIHMKCDNVISFLLTAANIVGPPPEASPTLYSISRPFLAGNPSEKGLKMAKFANMEKSIILIILISRHFPTIPT